MNFTNFLNFFSWNWNLAHSVWAENNAQHQLRLALTLGIGLLGTLHHCCFKILQYYNNNSNSNNIKLFSSSPINFFRENDFFFRKWVPIFIQHKPLISEDCFQTNKEKCTKKWSKNQFKMRQEFILRKLPDLDDPQM